MKNRNPFLLNRRIVMVMILVISSVLLVSCCIEHECIGEECPVCLQMASTERLLAGLAFCGLTWLMLLAAMLGLLPSAFCKDGRLPATLITMKVKLSD